MRLLLQETNVDVFLIICFRLDRLDEDSLIFTRCLPILDFETMAEWASARRLFSALVVKGGVKILLEDHNVIAYTEQFAADVIIAAKSIRAIDQNIYILA